MKEDISRIQILAPRTNLQVWLAKSLQEQLHLGFWVNSTFKLEKKTTKNMADA